MKSRLAENPRLAAAVFFGCKPMTEDAELVEVAIHVLSGFDDEAQLKDWLKSATHNAPNTKRGPLGSELVRHLYEQIDPLTLILRAHLYVEFFLDAILARKLKRASILLENRDFTFSMKVDVLRSANYLDATTYGDIKLLNKLRNNFGHDLFYDISNFDVSRFTYWENVKSIMERLKNAEAKRLLAIYVFQHAVMDLLFRLTKKHTFIGAIQLPS